MTVQLPPHQKNYLIPVLSPWNHAPSGAAYRSFSIERNHSYLLTHHYFFVVLYIPTIEVVLHLILKACKLWLSQASSILLFRVEKRLHRMLLPIL